MLGRYDPRPVQPDSLFPVFSVTKGITAGMLHWLADNGYGTILLSCYHYMLRFFKVYNFATIFTLEENMFVYVFILLSFLLFIFYIAVYESSSYGRSYFIIFHTF